MIFPKQFHSNTMKKSLQSLVLLIALCFTANAQLNCTFRSNLPYGFALSNIGGYVDSLGNEYALVGTYQGLSIVDVTDPVNPIEKFTVSGTPSDWREVKTWQQYAYVTTEGCCNGLQIVDLSDLPNSINSKFYNGDGTIAGQLNTIHSLHIDNGYVYLNGSNLFSGSAIILDLADPWNPVYQGHTPTTYIHDCYVRNDTIYGCHIYDGYFSVIDATNKTSPVLITTQNTPNVFTHNAWLNDAGNVLFTTDEVSDSYLAAYDISDLTNINELGRIQLTPGSGSIVHNTHTLNDYEIVSWYKDGIAIVDVSRPNNMIVVGSYDSYSQGAGDGFNGCWGVYPYLPSGNLVLSDIDNGLFVVSPNYVRGCYLEGIVTDSVSGATLNNVTIEILTTGISKQSKLTGEYKTGLATAGTYDIQFSKPGYNTKIISGVSLANGVLTNLDVQLVSFSTITLTGTVTDANTGNPIPNAIVNFNNSQFDFSTTTNAFGVYTLNSFYAGTYDITAGIWGYNTNCDNQNISGGPINISLAKGYYDDFSLDFGWTVSGPSPNSWERGTPIGTFTSGGSVAAAPGNDVAGDCGFIAFVTDNGGGGAWDNDVDQGSTILTSPIFDATTYTNPSISYSRWFFNGGFTNGAPDDTMTVKLTDGTTTVVLEKTYAGQPGQSQWLNQTKRIADFLTPGTQMQLIVEISDPGPVFNIVEGGLDNFKITEITGLSTAQPSVKVIAYPNPFSNLIAFDFSNFKNFNGTVTISDISGRVLETKSVSDQGIVQMGKQLKSGVYFADFTSLDGNHSKLKIVKQ